MVEQTGSRVASGVGLGRYGMACRTKNDFHQDVGKLPHPAADYLDVLRTIGARALIGASDWTQGKKDAAIRRGPHNSTHEHREFLEGEMMEMISKGRWIVLP